MIGTAHVEIIIEIFVECDNKVMAKFRPVEPCKLCGETRELVQSHLLARGFYELLRDRNPAATNKNPIVMSRKVSIHSSRQVADYVLCARCDQRMATNGEEWMLTQVNNGDAFPLLDRLHLALPIRNLSGPEVQTYSTVAVGIDSSKLAYFALSVLWRASVHAWNISSVETTSITLGEFGGAIKRYLLGGGEFPSDVTVMATVCTDLPSKEGCYVPCAVKGGPYPAFGFLVRGVYFRAFMASDLPQGFRDLCCFSSPLKLIFERNCEREALETWSRLLRSSRPVGELAGVRGTL